LHPIFSLVGVCSADSLLFNESAFLSFFTLKVKVLALVQMTHKEGSEENWILKTTPNTGTAF
jgi:hypothetical protein